MALKIELAAPLDAEECESLTHLAALSEDRAAGRNGFLLSSTSAENFREYIASASLYVAREDSIIIGFAVAYPRGSQPFEELLALFPQIEWSDASIAERQQLIYVDKKAVHPEYRRKGVATSLYEFLFTKFPDYCFIGATVEKPVLNLPSQQFRLRHGFRRVGEFRSPEFAGLINYQSGIYAREATHR